MKIICRDWYKLKTHVDKLLDQRYPSSRRDNRMACTVRNSALAYCAGNRRRLRRTLCPIFRRPLRQSGRNWYDCCNCKVYKRSSACRPRASTADRCRSPRTSRSWDPWCCAYIRICHGPYFPHRRLLVTVNTWRRARSRSTNHESPYPGSHNNISRESQPDRRADRRLKCEVSSY